MWGTVPSMDELQEAIEGDPTCHPIGMRMRAAYFLKQVYMNSKKEEEEGLEEKEEAVVSQQQQQQQSQQSKVIEILTKGLRDQRHGSLMRHEFAYVLGQLADPQSCSVLEDILKDPNDCVMVRHEAAEALGAIGLASSRNVLVQHSEIIDDDDVLKTVPQELADTCMLALNVMDWRLKKQQRQQSQPDNNNNNNEVHTTDNNNNEYGDDDDLEPVGCACILNPYSSIDPAPPHPQHGTLTYNELGLILRNESFDLFQRYRAMFSLRNRGGPLAVQELCTAMIQDTTSILFRHEVAYVLGQLQHPDSIPALIEMIQRRREEGGEEFNEEREGGSSFKRHEHMMVRHEAAEALGAIDVTTGDQWKRIESILKEFSTDPEQVVAESCLVALDAADYWGHSTTNTTASANDNGNNEEHDDNVVKNIPKEIEEKKEAMDNHCNNNNNNQNDTNEEVSYNDTSFGHQKAHSEKQQQQQTMAGQHFNMRQ